MDAIGAFLQAIPSAATSPLALIAYLAAIIAWVVLSHRKGLIQSVGPFLRDLPRDDRASTFNRVLPGGDVPADYTAADYSANKNAERRLYALYAVLAAVVIVFAIAGYKAHNELARSDGMIGEILDDGRLRTPIANLDRGTELVSGASEERSSDIPSNMSANELGEYYDRLRMGNPSMNNLNALTRRSQENSSGGRLQAASGILNRAAGQLNNAFEKIDNCYREGDCVKSSRTPELCQLTYRILSDTNAINGSIGDDVMVDTTDAAPNFGNGAMDRYFHKVTVPNIADWHARACS